MKLFIAAALMLASAANAAVWERPAGAYTPTNHSVNTTKYQTDSANHVAISSAKVDGDINKAFEGLNNLEARVAPSVVGQSGKFLTNNGASTFWGLISPTSISSGAAAAGQVLKANGSGSTVFGLLDTTSFANLGVAGTYNNPTFTVNTAGMVTSITSSQIITLIEAPANGSNTVTVAAPVSLSTNVSLTLPETSGTVARLEDVGRQYIKTVTVTNSPSVVFDSSSINDVYKRYEIEVIDAIPATDAVVPVLLMSTDNGGSYQSSYRYFNMLGTSNGVGQTNAASATSATIPLSGQSAGNFVGNGLGRSFNATISLNNPRSTQFKSVRVHSEYTGESGFATLFMGTGQTNSTATVNNVQLKFSTGNISAGTFILYGLKQ